METALLGLRSALILLFLGSAWASVPRRPLVSEERARIDRLRMMAWRLMAAAVLLGAPVHFQVLGAIRLSVWSSEALQLALMLCWLAAVLLFFASRTLWNGGSRRDVILMLGLNLAAVVGCILGAELLR